MGATAAFGVHATSVKTKKEGQAAIYTQDHPDWIIRPAKDWHCIPSKM
jgi:hypothetical protein